MGARPLVRCLAHFGWLAGRVFGRFTAFWLVRGADFRQYLPHFGCFGGVFWLFFTAFWLVWEGILGHFPAFCLVCIVFLSCFCRILAGTQAMAQGPCPAYPPEWVKNPTKNTMLHRQNGGKWPKIPSLHRQNGVKISQNTPPATPKWGKILPKISPTTPPKWVKRPKTRPATPPKWAKHRTNGPAHLP